MPDQSYESVQPAPYPRTTRSFLAKPLGVCSQLPMRNFFRIPLVVLVSLAATFAGASPDSAYLLAFSDNNTNAVVTVLENGIAQCQRLDAVYRFDCYRQNYRDAGSKMKGRPDYRTAQKALQRVEQTLKATVRQNRDKTAPTIRVNGKTYKPVTPAAVKPGEAGFARARAAAVTTLLRADGRAAVHYQRIASVVGSNKVIIRS